MSEITIQLGLYGGCTELVDFHVVEAHTRVLADGSSVFVSEHLRWNRGRQGPRLALPRSPEPGVEHPSLFGAPTPPEPETAPPAAQAVSDEEERAAARAGQLSLW